MNIKDKILQLAEQYAINNLTFDKFVMAVVSQRKELISYYERRGYTRRVGTDNLLPQ